jgi:hypothetical protein
MLALGSLFAVIVAPAHAQRPISLTLAGGASIPVASFADGVGTGWHALAVVGLGSLMQPIGLRLDAAYHRFPFESPASGDQVSTSATLNATYRLPMTNSPFSPYIITGAGAYRFECAGSADCGTTTRFGWNVGFGVKFHFGLKGFVESRFHAINSRSGNVRYVPVTLGLTF